MMEELTPQGASPAEPQVDTHAGGNDEAEEALAEAHRQRRMFFVSFGTILFVGLALALAYLSGRVMETRAAGAPAVKSEHAIQTVAAKPLAVLETGKQQAPSAPSKPRAIAPEEVSVTKQPNPASPASPAKPSAAGPATMAVNKQPSIAPAATAAQSKPSTAVPPPVAVAKSPAVAPTTVAVARPLAIAPVPATPPPPGAIGEKVAVKAAPPAAGVSPAPKQPEISAESARPQKAYGGPIIKPRPGETYVQVGAYGPTYAAGFLAALERKGFHGVVALGPTDDVYRVLVGPVADQTAVKSELEKAGLAGAFDRRY